MQLRITRTVTETIEYVSDRPHRPTSPASPARVVVDATAEEHPSATRLRVAAPSNVVSLSDRLAALDRWTQKPLRTRSLEPEAAQQGGSGTAAELQPSCEGAPS